MNRAFIPYAKQTINSKDIDAVVDALKKDVITRGDTVAAFESAVAEYCGASYAVAFNSGTSALIASCSVVDASHFDHIITTPNTFLGTVAGGVHCDSAISFVDIDEATGNMDLSSLKEVMDVPMSRGKRIIMPVHYSGIPVDMGVLEGYVKNIDTMIIEDGCHALGGSYVSGEKIGSCVKSDMTVFSFHPAKNITTGEGGMVTTNDGNLYHRLLRFRNNGIERDEKYLKGTAAPGYYEIHEVTGNYNFTDFQAALGLSQLERLDDFVAKRRQVVSWYRQRLSKMKKVFLSPKEYDVCSGHHLFFVRIDFDAIKKTREEVMQALAERNIGTNVHYIPLYKHYALKDYAITSKGPFPAMEKFYAQMLTLPLHCGLTEKDVDYICKELMKQVK